MRNTKVVMPKLGQAMTEGVVVRWHRKNGGRVTAGELLVTVETDKATYDLEATASGTLHIVVQEGEEVPIHTVIGEIGDAPVQADTTTALPPAEPVVQQRIASRPRRVLASPKAKRLAAERGIDLSTLTPSSADGVISAADVEQAAENAVAQQQSATATRPGSAPTRTERERRPLTGIRKASARRVQAAWQTIPHIVQMIEVDAGALQTVRERLKADISGLTLNDLILHAAARVLAGLPDLNATVENEELILYDGVDIGFAVDSPRGLLVPVIRGADGLSIAQLAKDRQRLVEVARAGQLQPADMGQASLTVSNLGMFGIRAGTPVINLGEPILVFVGAVEERPVVRNGQIIARPMLTLSIAYDHRVADGVAASRLSQGLKEALENLGSESFSKVSNSQPLTPNPQEALDKREVRSMSAGERYAVRVRSHAHVWSLDEPASDGGEDTGPDPVTAFLGALLSCMTIAFKAAARRRKISIERIEGRAKASLKGQVKDITLTLAVWSSASEQDAQILLERAKRGCYVSGMLRPDIHLTVELVRHAPDAASSPRPLGGEG